MDSIIRGILLGGEASFVLCRTTEVCEKVRTAQNSSPVCTAALGRLISSAAMMSMSLKNDGDSLSITVNGGGPCGQLIAVAEKGSLLKACAANPYIELPPRSDGKLDVGGAVGKDGFVTVIRRMGNMEPYIGKTELVSGEIGEDLAMYYTVSEQTPTAHMVGVLIDTDGKCAASGGLLIQMLPDSSEAALLLIESALKTMAPISSWINSKENLSELAGEKLAFLDHEVLDTIKPEWFCNCSENIRKAVVAIGIDEANKVVEEQGVLEVVCHFCNKSVRFDKDDLKELFNVAEA